MGYESAIPAGMPILTNPITAPRGIYRGYEGRRVPLLSGHASKGFDLPLIKGSERDDLIEAQEKSKTTIPDLCDAAGLKVKNQASTNFCWINAPVHILEVDRVIQGEEYVELSPASVGSIIMNFRNRGGSGVVGMEWMAEHGCVPARLWPCNAISKQYDTPEADAERAKYKPLEYYDLDPRDEDAIISCILQGKAVSVGVPSWSHEVTLSAVLKRGNGYDFIFDNSWDTSYGTNGRGVFHNTRFDEAIACGVVVAS